YQVYAIKTVPYHNYQFIPLFIMQQLAEHYAGLRFDDEVGREYLERDIESINQHPLLKKFAAYVWDYIAQHHQGSGLHYAVNALNCLTKTECQELYYNYIHNSLTPGDLANGGSKRNGG